VKNGPFFAAFPPGLLVDPASFISKDPTDDQALRVSPSQFTPKVEGGFVTLDLLPLELVF